MHNIYYKSGVNYFNLVASYRKITTFPLTWRQPRGRLWLQPFPRYAVCLCPTLFCPNGARWILTGVRRLGTVSQPLEDDSHACGFISGRCVCGAAAQRCSDVSLTGGAETGSRSVSSQQHDSITIILLFSLCGPVASVRVHQAAFTHLGYDPVAVIQENPHSTANILKILLNVKKYSFVFIVSVCYI